MRLRSFVCLVVAWGFLWASTAFAAESVSAARESVEFNRWSVLLEGEAEGSVEKGGDSNLAKAKSDSVRFTVKAPGRRCGIVSVAGTNVTVHSGRWYDVTFQAGSEKRENNRGYGLTFSFENLDSGKVCARTTLPEVGGEWAQYSVALFAHHSDSKARVTITLSEPGTIWLDDIVVSARKPKTP